LFNLRSLTRSIIVSEVTGSILLREQAIDTIALCMTISFLTARWINLCLLTYAVPSDLLQPRVPPGLELDTRDGEVFISLVAFQFADTRVLGVSWPGYREFAEINLRFYVRNGQDRGVVFIRELAPHRFVAWVARAFYHEPYHAAPVFQTVKESDKLLAVESRLTWNGQVHRISVKGHGPAYCPTDSSTEHFFKEHHWGFGVSRSGQTVSYRVDHPVWDIYHVNCWELHLDWATVYGKEWSFLQRKPPHSVILAAGSPVTVYYPKRLDLPLPAPA
jgi:uncharacterized protein YqjF (DUF2071 family)